MEKRKMFNGNILKIRNRAFKDSLYKLTSNLPITEKENTIMVDKNSKSHSFS